MKADLLEAAPELQTSGRTQFHANRVLYPWDVLLPVSLAFWAFGVSQVHASKLGQYGLPTSLPIVFYVGIGILVISIGWALAMAHPSPVRLAAHLGSLILILYGTAPLVYSEGRYTWLYKYIGVVQYVNLHGRVNQRIDIFQNWPGFFAIVAWFDKVAGVQSPLAYAKWAQLAFELLTCLMLSFVFRALPLSLRERWLALFLYAGSIWIAQDYLSAQGLGVVLAAGAFGLALTYLYQDSEDGWITWLRKRPQSITRIFRRSTDPPVPRSEPQMDATGSLAMRRTSRVQDAAVIATISVVYFVLVFEHELSPYVVLIQLACLAIIGRLRHRWLVIILTAIAFGYLAPRFTFVNNEYGLLKSIGNFFGNAAPPLVSLGAHVKVSAGVTLSAEAARLLSLGMWALGAVGAWRRWRSGRPTLPLVLLAYSPALVFFAGAYGNEGLLRVYLFSLPWTACLAASAIGPVEGNLRKLGVLRAPVVLVVVIALFIPAFFGDDYSNVVSKSEVQGVLAFYRSAPRGTIFAGDANFPSQLSGRYNLFPEVALFGAGGIFEGARTVPSAADLTKAIEADDPAPDEPEYVLISSTMQHFGTAYGFLYPNQLRDLSKKFDNAPGWFRIFHNDGLTVFELPPNS